MLTFVSGLNANFFFHTYPLHSRKSHFYCICNTKTFYKYCICNSWRQIWSIKLDLFGYFQKISSNKSCTVSKMEAEGSQIYWVWVVFAFFSVVFTPSKSAQINHVFHPSIAYATLVKYYSIGNAILWMSILQIIMQKCVSEFTNDCLLFYKFRKCNSL